ncbi:MAG: flagellar hook-length control protein FliK [Sandarakinorhabdus sp.]|nr:flagellar hook-length control protein FliK [Sandarakinorhabdus sp.]
MSGEMGPLRAATAMTVTTEQLGAVSIGVDDDAGHLRVRLSGSALAMDTVAAQAPRLVAELAATGVRLSSLDIAGRADNVLALASAGNATSDQRAPGGQTGGDALVGGGTDARGAPPGDGRPRSAAGIAALARGGIAGDPVAAPRFSPSDRYA